MAEQEGQLSVLVTGGSGNSTSHVPHQAQHPRLRALAFNFASEVAVSVSVQYKATRAGVVENGRARRANI
jgi:hypothetical protein